MKQQLKNFNRIKYIKILSLALLLLVALSLFIITKSVIKHIGINKEMTKLAALVSQNNTDIKEQLANTYSSYNPNTSNESGEYKLKSLDEIVELLKEYPGDYDTAIQRTDIYSVAFGFPLFGWNLWDRFIADCRLGKPGNLVMVEFSPDFECVYYYLEFDGSYYHVVEDRSKSTDDGDSGYSECYGSILRVEQYPIDSGYAEYAYVTDDESLTYPQIALYYASEDRDPSEEPSFWGFYVGTTTYDMLLNAMMTEEITSKAPEDFDGFTFRHPEYAVDNPLIDYDGDGILDKIYRECLIDEDGNRTVNVYMFMGNGNNVLLAEDIKSNRFKTYLNDNGEVILEEY